VRSAVLALPRREGSALRGEGTAAVTTVEPRRLGDSKLTTAEAAALAGVTPATWRAWRAHGRPRHPEPAPEPDGWIEMQRPFWWHSTVAAWVQRRNTWLEAHPQN